MRVFAILTIKYRTVRFVFGFVFVYFLLVDVSVR